MKTKYVRDFFIPEEDLYDFKKKRSTLRDIKTKTYKRTNRMFKYNSNLDHIDWSKVEIQLQRRGHMGVIYENDKIYILQGDFAGILDENYFPTQYIIVNPYLNISKTYTIGKDCIVLRSDSLYDGLDDMISMYGSLMSENYLSLEIADIVERIKIILSAGDSRTRESAQKFLDDVIEGKLGTIQEPKFVEELVGLKTALVGTTQSKSIMEMVELDQYLKGSLWMDIGVKAPFNMKREALGDSENGLQDDSLLPLVDDMLKCRQEDLEAAEKLFNVEIATVEFDSAWEDIHDETTENLEEEEDAEQIEEIDEVEDNEVKEEVEDNEVKEEVEDTEESEEPEEDEKEDEEPANDVDDKEEDDEDER